MLKFKRRKGLDRNSVFIGQERRETSSCEFRSSKKYDERRSQGETVEREFLNFCEHREEGIIVNIVTANPIDV
jgi:hypothetical protein